MKKFTRNQRVIGITKNLIENPNKVINLNTFTEQFEAAKSTISEDIVIIRELFKNLKIGNVETITGAAGGIKFINQISKEEALTFAEELSCLLKDKNRVISGSFLYMTDIMYNPTIVHKGGKILASVFKDLKIDYVVTVETKGIPLAYEVAKMLGVQLVIVRRETKVTEGPTVSINYLSGSDKRIQTMSLAKRVLKSGSKCIFIDDFMKAGGTASGIIDLLKEFNSELLGIGVLVDNKDTSKKLIGDYFSILELNGVDQEGNVSIEPSNKLEYI